MKKKYFIDTNYFLRLVLQDNADQFQVVKHFFADAEQGNTQLYTSPLVLFELYWVLSKLYQQSKTACLEKFLLILQMQFIFVEDRDLLEKSLEIWRDKNLDLEDCYHLVKAKEMKCDVLSTFDKKLNSYARKYLA